ncbi:hypothetical protein B1J92_E04972g [Nakaseomyces glabratus]|nr:hypothetical protein B1J91_E04972g [Nakaseomyces glabratus]OXB49739.1 hypothetical protein B1J92_E04972g [Nakaseomyces glabratus]
MLNDINDLLDLEKHIDEIEQKRNTLANELETYRNGVVTRKIHEEQESIDLLAERILAATDNLEAIEQLKTEFGELRILKELETDIKNRNKKKETVDELQKLEPELNEVIESNDENTITDSIINLHDKISLICNDEIIHLDDYIQYFIFKFEDELVRPVISTKMNELQDKLLKSYWDNQKKNSLTTNQINDLRSKSSELFRLNKCLFNNTSEPLANMKAIANNFKVRFTYHFHNSTTDIETYFKFLKDYLHENLYQCISIFYDPSVGLSKAIIHQEFINNVLNPIREKIRSTLSTNDLKSAIFLISQILATDKILSKTFHYQGSGLASLISDDQWEKWINYEEEITKKQFSSITGNTEKELLQSANNFNELIKKTYVYLEPLLTLEYEPAQKFKLQCCSNIFLNLFSMYLEHTLAVDTLGEKRSKDEELQQTLIKLNNLCIVANKIIELQGMEPFVLLTDIVNRNEAKNYISVFQDILNDYEQNIQIDIQRSIVHRLQKLLKDTLRNYFKITGWSTDYSQEELTTPSSEIIAAINLLTRIFIKIDTLQVPPSIVIQIKNDILNVLVLYFTESILKLNKFNKRGLLQFELDFNKLKDCLSLPYDNFNFKERMLTEILHILRLKYDSAQSHFYEKQYIKQGLYDDLRAQNKIEVLKDTEIQDALYRIAYGNIVE